MERNPERMVQLRHIKKNLLSSRADVQGKTNESFMKHSLQIKQQGKTKKDSDKVKSWDLFVAFFRSGMLGYGGGLSAIPLMKREVVDTYKWMEDDEFSDILALANTLPGPINTKMSGYIGWRVGGFWGMMSALAGTVLPTVVLLIILLTVLNAYKDKPWVNGMSRAVIPIAGVMLGVLTWDFIKKSKNTMGWMMTVILLIISIVVMQILGIHPAILIVALLGSALLSKDKKEEKQVKAS